MAFTVVTASHYGYALAHARSIKKHNPDVDVACFVIGKGLSEKDKKKFPGPLFDFDKVAQDDPKLFNLAFKYTPFQLCCALKPYVAQYILSMASVDRLIYFDSDILVCSSLAPVLDALAEKDILLTPHRLEPKAAPVSDWLKDESNILVSGAFNMGFFAVKRSQAAVDFLHWWQERTFVACEKAPEKGLFDDQRWADLAPALFPSLGILRHPGCNVAHWNIHERNLTQDKKGRFCVNDEKLIFFHFSGWRPSAPLMLSQYNSQWVTSEDSPLGQLIVQYADGLLKARIAAFLKTPYSYAAFDNGVYILPIVRKLFSDSANINPDCFGNPFETEKEHSFFRWLFDPGSEDVTPLALAMRSTRQDVEESFKELQSSGARRRLQKWASDLGCHEMNFPKPYGHLMRLATQKSEVSLRLKRMALPMIANLGARRPINGFGVNLIGMLSSDKGVGVGARGSEACLRAAGIPFSTVNFIEPSSTHLGKMSIRNSGNSPFSVNLIHLSGTDVYALGEFGRSLLAGRKNIGYWAWEFEELTPDLKNCLHFYDEVWVPSQFVQKSLLVHSPVPVVCVPHPIVDPGAGPAKKREGPFTFGFMFDFDSYYHRKNPEGLIKAFQMAFPKEQNVRLLIKSVRGHKHPRFEKALKKIVASDPRLQWTDMVYSSEELNDWWSRLDAYVSLHRGEGFGLTLAEAMSRGLPTIGTGYSGNLDFMTEKNSLLVPFERGASVEVFGPYVKGLAWANPQEKEAAQKMRWVFENVKHARALGQLGRKDILKKFSLEKISAIYRQRLVGIRRREAFLSEVHA